MDLYTDMCMKKCWVNNVPAMVNYIRYIRMHHHGNTPLET